MWMSKERFEQRSHEGPAQIFLARGCDCLNLSDDRKQAGRKEHQGEWANEDALVRQKVVFGWVFSRNACF